MNRATLVRATFAALMILSLAAVASAYLGDDPDASGFEGRTQEEVLADSTEYLEERDDVTVVSGDSNEWMDYESDSPRGQSELVAYAPNGSILYYNNSRSRYWDVDPAPDQAGEQVVEYTFSDVVRDCPEEYDPAEYAMDEAEWARYEDAHEEDDACTREGIEQVDLRTGETTVLWSRITPGRPGMTTHDADRVDETRFLVADILLDRAIVVDVEREEVVWTWNASEAFDPETTGGPHGEDWTHVNDVEVIDGGERYMFSLRNLDRVVFVDAETGELDEDWTLGSEDDYETLYEQHNPDYIPEADGGPALLVADSENNRLIEYQREDGEWERSWEWTDEQLQWPRDADRLPNGHTLITDSNGNRVFEVDANGEIVWSARIAFPYEAERYATGDESTGGPSAVEADLQSRDDGPVDSLTIAVKSLLPGKYLNALLYATPTWMDLREVALLLVAALAAIGWTGYEVRRRRVSGALRSRLRARRER